ncbi:GNAT family N-acetyltransferase [Cupriavidus necator]|uniref:GNAT family N-acetyltransferase n=1 Tax=Cupriavidus necator TaxID=106590 RepID=UPI00339D3F83
MKLLVPLTYSAFAATVDSAPLEQWTSKVSSIVNGRYGPFLPTASFVAEDPSGQLIGAILATDFPLYQAPVIALIAVAPSAQGRGVGSYLLLRCIDALSAEGFAMCRAKISAGNEASQRLFRKNAFELR